METLTNTNWVVDQMEKRYRFKGYTINCREEGTEETTEYYDVTFQGDPIELKVTYDHNGHWTHFAVEQRKGDSEDWHFFDSFDEYIR